MMTNRIRIVNAPEWLTGYPVLLVIVLSWGILVSSCTAGREEVSDRESTDWKSLLNEEIALLGHRNWVVVADAAYPLQSHPAIRTILSDDNHLTTVSKVFRILNTQPHVEPIVYLDLESDYLTDAEVGGIEAYIADLDGLFGDAVTAKALHEDIIQKLDRAAGLYSVLVIKTGYTLPYTSVFFELDCAYWGAEEEQQLREKMKD